MTLPRTVAEVLSEHVMFEVECIDRMYLNVYVPQLQHAGGLVGYVHRQLGLPIASTAPLAKITDRFTAAIRGFAADQRIPWVDFTKGQRKDDVQQEHLAAFEAAGRTEGVLFIGRAQERTALFRTEKRRHADGVSYPWIKPEGTTLIEVEHRGRSPVDLQPPATRRHPAVAGLQKCGQCRPGHSPGRSGLSKPVTQKEVRRSRRESRQMRKLRPGADRRVRSA
jgi:hypothetical protein